MGNFYTNLVMRAADLDAVASLLESEGRRAYVARVGAATFVYDERCDRQDIGELRGLAGVVSRECGIPVLAACNHDDDVLWLALAEDGLVVSVYNSFPAYFNQGGAAPELREVARICAAFGAAERATELDGLLRTPRADIGFEFERHQKVARLLGVSPDASILGYTYVRNGELGHAAPSTDVRCVGGAPIVAPAPSPDPQPVLGEPSFHAAPRESIDDVRTAMGALALSEVEVPRGLEPLLGEGPVNGLVALGRLQRYVAANGLLDLTAPGGPVVHADSLVQLLFGENDVPYGTFIGSFAERIGAWSALTEEEGDAIRSGDPMIRARVIDAMGRSLRLLAEDRLKRG
jgi:hypothetical protein